MTAVRPCALPPRALLARYTGDLGYTDCYTADIDGTVSHAQFVEAFYTGTVFKLERFLLKWLLSRPATDADARRLSTGDASMFSFWRVEARVADQLLMCDLNGRTRSWLMVEPVGGATRLYFGSAVVPVVGASGHRTMGVGFRALLGFHKLYSRVLLASARSRLVRSAPVAPREGA